MCAAAHWQTRVGGMCAAAHSRLHDHLMNPVRPILCTSTEIILKTGHSSVLMSGLSTLLRPAVGPESLHGEVLVVVPSSSRDMPTIQGPNQPSSLLFQSSTKGEETDLHAKVLTLEAREYA